MTTRALVLYAHPCGKSFAAGLRDTVNMSAARDFRSTAETAAIPPIGAVARAWISSDLNPTRVVGEAHLATAEKGRLTAEHTVADVLTLLRRDSEEPVPGR